jgi:hypothetical protein
MLNIGYIFPLVCFWHTITNEISKYKQTDTSNNIVSLLHCLLFIGHHGYNYNVDYAVHMSIGYYMYDLIYISSCVYKHRSKHEFNRRYPFIIHHVIGIYLLNACISDTNTGESKISLLYGYNLLETSNIMLYVSYHLHKEYPNYLHLNMISEFLQLLWYSYFRVINFLQFVVRNKNHMYEFCYVTQFFIAMLYFMGIIWSYKLLNKNIQNFKLLNGIYNPKYNKL